MRGDRPTDTFHGVHERDAVLLRPVAEAEGHGSGRTVLLPRDEDERHLARRVGADLLLHPIVGVVDLGAHPDGAERGDRVVEVLGILLGDGHAHDLHGRQPQREVAGIVLEQDREEALDRPEQRAVDHDGTLLLAVPVGELESETLGEVRVDLDRRQLPDTTDRVGGLEVDLGAVEGGLTRDLGELQPAGQGYLSQGIGRRLPELLGADPLVLLVVAHRQLELEIGQAEVPQHRDDELQDLPHLLLQTVRGDEEVGVVLGETTNAREPVQGAGELVAVDRPVLGETEREVPVAARALLVDEDVHRAVHRLEVVVDPLPGDVSLLVPLLVHPHRREHVVLVVDEVVRLPEQVFLRDVRRVHVGVAALDVPTARVLLHLAADDPSARVPHRHARAQLVREGEQVKLLAQAPVVALRRLLQPLLVGAKLVLRRPRGAVDALQLGVLLAPAPVRTGDACEIPAVADHAGARKMRTSAEVLPHHLAVTGHVVVDRQLPLADLDRGALCRLLASLEADELELERLVAELFARLVIRHDAADEPLPFANDPLHLLGDRLDVVRGEGRLDAEVVVEAVDDGRADAQVRLRLDPLHRLGEDVSCRMPQDVQSVRALDRDRLDLVAVCDRRREVLQHPVDTHGDDGTIGEQGEAVASTRRVDFRHRNSPSGVASRLLA
ncbi:hypothetical protein ABE10_12280 [Bacillus toyonensis]|nr:hypothetical protein [Bacillus toyonensis]